MEEKFIRDSLFHNRRANYVIMVRDGELLLDCIGMYGYDVLRHTYIANKIHKNVCVAILTDAQVFSYYMDTDDVTEQTESEQAG